MALDSIRKWHSYLPVAASVEVCTAHSLTMCLEFESSISQLFFFMRTCRSNWFGVGASSYAVEWRKMCFSYLRCVEQLKVQKWGQKQSDRCGKTCFKDRLGELMKKQPERVKDSNLSLNAEETRDQTTKCDKVSLLGYAIWIWKCACESRKESERKDRKKKRKRG